MKSFCGSEATPALSNVWCTLLARHALEQEQQLQLKQHHAHHHHHHHHYVPISLEHTIIWRQPEVKPLESMAHYLKLMSVSDRSVQRARRPRSQKPQWLRQRQPPDVAPEWAAASVRAFPASSSLSISVLIVSLRFEPHAPLDPQLAMTINGPKDTLSLLPYPATRADSQRKF